MQNPTPDELDDLLTEALIEPPPAWENPLEDLYAEALAGRKLRRAAQPEDPALRARRAADAATQRELYTNPDNWRRTRGIALIDRTSHTLLGNYSEYRHIKFPTTRKLLREHQPIQIDATEEIEGFLGERLEERLKGVRWEKEHHISIPVLFDELMVQAPAVSLTIYTSLTTVVRAELEQDTQFASFSGNMLICLPRYTNVWEAISSDTRAAIRKAVLV